MISTISPIQIQWTGKLEGEDCGTGITISYDTKRAASDIGFNSQRHNAGTFVEGGMMHLVVLVISGLDSVLYRTMKQFSIQFHSYTQEKTPQKEAEILEY